MDAPVTNPTTTPDTDVWSDIDSELDVAPPQQWEPEPGDRLLGIITDIEYRRPANSGRVVPVLTLKGRSGELWTVMAGRAVLLGQLLKHKVQPGDLIGIQFDGQVEPANGGRAYFGYRVSAKHTAPRGDDVLKDPTTMAVATAADDNSDLVEGATSDPWATSSSSEQSVGF